MTSNLQAQSSLYVRTPFELFEFYEQLPHDPARCSRKCSSFHIWHRSADSLKMVDSCQSASWSVLRWVADASWKRPYQRLKARHPPRIGKKNYSKVRRKRKLSTHRAEGFLLDPSNLALVHLLEAEALAAEVFIECSQCESVANPNVANYQFLRRSFPSLLSHLRRSYPQIPARSVLYWKMILAIGNICTLAIFSRPLRGRNQLQHQCQHSW